MKTNKQSGVAVLAILGVFIIGGTAGAVITATNQDVEDAVEKVVPSQETKYKAADSE